MDESGRKWTTKQHLSFVHTVHTVHFVHFVHGPSHNN